MTKQEITDLVIEQLSGGAPPDRHKWHPNVIASYVDLVLTEGISKVLNKNLDMGVNASWIKPFDKVRIKWDANRKQCYANFPAKPIMLNNIKGLQEVRWRDESVPSSAFQIIDPMAYPVISDLECSNLDTGVYHVTVEGEKMFFPDMPQNMAMMNAMVRLKMVVGTQGFKNNEELPLPDEIAASIVDKVVQFISGQKMTRQKMTNDSNPNTN